MGLGSAVEVPVELGPLIEVPALNRVLEGLSGHEEILLTRLTWAWSTRCPRATQPQSCIELQEPTRHGPLPDPTGADENYNQPISGQEPGRVALAGAVRGLEYDGSERWRRSS